MRIALAAAVSLAVLGGAVAGSGHAAPKSALVLPGGTPAADRPEPDGEPEMAPRRDRVAAVKTDTAPDIDGSLSDPAWRAAIPSARFVQRRPSPGDPPGDATELRILHGDGVVYFGIRMADRAPGEIRRVLGRRDSALASDSVTVYVDPLRGGQGAYFFTVNAAGILADGVVYNQTETDRSWDAIWTGAARVDEQGWSAELAIPLSTIPFQDRAEQSWGLYVERSVVRTQEVSGWPAMPPGGNAFVSLFGDLTGLRGLERPATVRIQPYAAGTVHVRDVPAGAPTSSTFVPNAGLDLWFSPTPKLRLVLAVNPDFGEVDQDPDVVNLTPEEVFLEERRPFFAAGLELFRTPTPPAQGRFAFLNTRRIGATPPPASPSQGGILIEADEQRRILGALKILGEADRDTSYGAISVLEESTHVVEAMFDPISEGTKIARRQLTPMTHYGVVRARRRLGERSYVGFIGTSVNRLGENGEMVQPSGEITADTDAYVGAADWLFRDASGRQLTGFVSASRSREGPGVAGYLQAGQLGFREWIYKAELELYSSQYDINDAGFLRRNDHMQGVVRVDRQLVKPWGPLLRGNLALTTIHALGLAEPDQVQRRFVRFNAGATARNNWQLSTALGYDFPRVDPLETRGGPLFPRPRAATLLGDLQTSAAEPVWATWHNQVEHEGEAWRWTTQLTSSAALFDRWTVSLMTGWRANRGDPFFIDTIRNQGPPQTVVGDLDFNELELRLNSALGLSRVLTLQAFIQVLRAVGRYQRFRELEEGASGEVGFVDSDFPGGLDFVRLSLATNTVLRWDLGGGTAALLAYRAESLLSSAGDAAPFSVRESFDRLVGQGLAQQLLVKISYAWDAL
ncbi:MAG TPA: DUF5916 domain-containing protein [Candidatus Acidoferrum sp.]|nr:DUF5916 domain-containing protein [Candidatus Acidoferrum sp.]